MSILGGGVWAASAFANNMQCDSPALTTTALSWYLRTVPDPLGRTYNVLQARISQGDYAAAPSESSMRAEAQVKSTVCQWGTAYLYYWRMVVPPDWVNYGASSYAVVGQCHDVDAGAVARRPTMTIEVINNVLAFNFSNDVNPSGVNRYTKNISAGMELEFSVAALWADGNHVANGSGYVRIYDGDTLVYSETGHNSWADAGLVDANPSYQKAGIYQPNTADSWWAGRQLSWYHVATITASSDETPATLRARVDALLAANTNSTKPIVIRA